MLRRRQPPDSDGAAAKDVARGASFDPAARRLRYFTEAGLAAARRRARRAAWSAGRRVSAEWVHHVL